MFTKDWFFDLERRLKDVGLDSDQSSFDEIKSNLQNPQKLSPEEFADCCVYVILAGGFSQKTAKIIHAKIMDKLMGAGQIPLLRRGAPEGGGVVLQNGRDTGNDIKSGIENNADNMNRLPNHPGASSRPLAALTLARGTLGSRHPSAGGEFPPLLQSETLQPELLNLFNNKNKINAIVKIWENRDAYRDGYYKLNDLDSKISYLSTLPHIGKITANHLARNLGENVVKYDIWIQRLGAAFAAQRSDNRDQSTKLESKIDNGNLGPEIKKACDEMFSHLERETGLPRGYIDVVLWKGCQSGMIDIR